MATNRAPLRSTENVQRWLSILVGAAAALLAVALTWKSIHPKPLPLTDGARGDAGDAALADASDKTPTDAQAAERGDGGMFLSDLQLPAGPEGRDGGTGFRMSDGTAVPPLPEKAPKTVRFGVILVQFQGAQGASATARPKPAARELIDRLAVDAKTDFRGAAQHGDSGSGEDLGKIPRGVLEPAPEYVLFTLAPGTVSDPFETPRGYWIVKRIE